VLLREQLVSVGEFKDDQGPFEKLAVKVFVIKEEPNQVFVLYQLSVKGFFLFSFLPVITVERVNPCDQSFQLIESDQLSFKVPVQDQVKN
jgi:hypothetical protein